MTHIREYTAIELGLPAGTMILSATTPFDGDLLELIVRLPEEQAPPKDVWDMTPGFDAATGQGHLFSPAHE